MQDYSNANKRVVKNTILLYLRMIVSTIVSLYTARIVLGALGAEDYGIYNVVAGFVTLLAFVNGSMVSATRRYMTIAIANNDLENRKLTFSTSFYVHLGIAILVTILASTVGYYFLEYEMNIPIERKGAANWVFVTSMLSVLALCVTVPHNALVVAYEKMGTFAFLSIVEVFLKLLIAVLIAKTHIDKLILYSMLLCAVSVLVRLLYVIYCHIKFEDVSYVFFKDNVRLVKKMLSFAGWNVFSSASIAAYNQGVNLLLNIFFTPVVNAARGIAMQVQGAISLLAINFQQAVNPQITKSYAISDFHRTQKLVFISIKGSYLLIFLILFPIIIETSSILDFWLGDVPEYTVAFVRYTLCIVLLDTVTNPLTTAVLAKGEIRKYQLMTGIIQLMVVPISYIVLKFCAPPTSVYIVNLVIVIALGYYKIYKTFSLLHFDKSAFIKIVLMPISMVTVVTVVAYACASSFISANPIWNMIVITVCSILAIVCFGFSANERKYLLKLILKKVK